MYQHPAALDLNSSHYQREALREAAQRRLVHEAEEATPLHTAVVHFQRRMVAIAVALVTILGVVALI